MRIFRACLIVFFMSRILDKIMTRIWGLLRCCVYFVVTFCCVTFICGFLSEDLSRSSSNSFNWILIWTRVVSTTRTCPAYGVTDYYPFNSYNEIDFVIFVILVIILGSPFLRFGTTMQTQREVNYMCFWDFLNEKWRLCTRWYIHFS